MHVLQGYGNDTIGFDLSSELLEQASNANVIRSNLLSFPFQGNIFNAVTSIFSSFGYFEEETDDLWQLSEVARVLQPGGWFILDTAPVRTLDNLVPVSNHIFSDGVKAEITRHREGNRVIKIVHLSNGESWEEHLRIYDTKTLDEMTSSVKLDLRWRIGDYNGADFNEIRSPRIIGCYVRTN